MKVIAHFDQTIEIEVPDKFSPIVSNPDWWESRDESVDKLATELWNYAGKYADNINWIDNEDGETILEA
jgi:hypothetical protein